MKVITSVKLHEYIKKNGSGGLVYCSALMNELEDIDQITVSRLRPMSEVKFNEVILLKVKGIDEMYSSIITDQCDLSTCEGWVPITLYKPTENSNENQ
jgi:hypothetical protein